MTRRPQFRLLVSLATFAVPIVIAACGESTDPEDKLDVKVDVGWVMGPNFNQAPESGNRVACDVNLKAVATGSGRARWETATFKWYGGKDRSTPIDSSVVPASDIRRGWSDSSIVAGGRQDATWTLWADVPFSTSIDFHYRLASGRQQTATVSFDCGPAVPPGASPPAVPSLTTELPTGDLQPGGHLSVTYTATSSVGVWSTAVLVSGPCEVFQEFSERLEPSVTRNVLVQIPTGCELGAPVEVAVFATDAALERRSRHISTPYSLVDKTPPWIRGVFAPRPAGPYFTGDTIDFVVSAGDNDVVKSLVWEVRPFGVRDSLLTPQRGVDVKIRIPVRSAWSGPVELRYFARDAAGLVSDTLASAAGGVAIYPTLSRATSWADVDGDISGEVVDQVRGVVYLMQAAPRRIVVLSLASMEVVSTIPLAPAPGDIDLTAGGDSLLVALPELNALGIIDLRRADRRLELLTLTPPEGFPEGARVSVSTLRALSNGKAFLVASMDPGSRRLLEIDFASGAQRYRYDVGSGNGYGGAVGGQYIEGPLLARTHDGSVMSVVSTDCVQRYDAMTDKFGSCGRITTPGVVTSMDASGQRLSAGPDVYDASWRHLLRVETLPLGSALSSALTLDGRDLFFPFGAGIVRSSAVDGRIYDRQLGPVRATRVSLSPDGRRLIAVGISVTTGRAAISVTDLR